MPLSALYYPKGTEEKPIAFESLFIPAIYHEIYYDAVYLDIVNQLKNTKKKEDVTIVDLGANCGIVTQYLREFGNVYSVEPSSEHFEALKENKRFNKWDNVKLYNYAIADKDGEMTIHHNVDNLTCNSLVLKFAHETESKVKTKKLTSFFREAGIKHVDFMKFDVEGAEDIILPSADFKKASKMIDCIEIEFHFPDFPKHINRLIKMGYTARRYNCSAVVVAFHR